MQQQLHDDEAPASATIMKRKKGIVTEACKFLKSTARNEKFIRWRQKRQRKKERERAWKKAAKRDWLQAAKHIEETSAEHQEKKHHKNNRVYSVGHFVPLYKLYCNKMHLKFHLTIFFVLWMEVRAGTRTKDKATMMTPTTLKLLLSAGREWREKNGRKKFTYHFLSDSFSFVSVFLLRHRRSNRCRSS